MTKDKPTEEVPAEDVPMITFREPIISADGVQSEKLHVVPVADWPAYEKEHNL